MTIVFRTDSSIKIGTGHLMRCLTLADRFREDGNAVHFICRNLKGNLSCLPLEKGYSVHYLTAPSVAYTVRPDDCPHAEWLEVGQNEDARQTLSIVEEYDIKPELLVIDHYALDYRFEKILKPQVECIAVVDDLADRRHECDMLLDQNIQPNMKSRYNALVPANCQKLLGPQYALLRPEFQRERECQAERDGRVRKMLVFFGGIDNDNVTSMALNTLSQMNLEGIEIDVVIGKHNPHQIQVREICQKMPNVRLHCQTDNFARLMSRADLALCASGTTTWERCALGLPSVMISVAANQVSASQACHDAGVAHYLGKFGEVVPDEIRNTLHKFIQSPARLLEMRKRAREIVDAGGCARVAVAIAEMCVCLKEDSLKG